MQKLNGDPMEGLVNGIQLRPYKDSCISLDEICIYEQNKFCKPYLFLLYRIFLVYTSMLYSLSQ